MYKCVAAINFKDDRKTIQKIGYGNTLLEAMTDSTGVYSIGKEVHAIIYKASKEDDYES